MPLDGRHDVLARREPSAPSRSPSFVNPLVLTLACVAVLGCGASPSPRAPHAARVPPLFTAVTGGLPDLVADATRLDQTSSSARFDALIALLRERDVSFAIQPFSAGGTEEHPRVAGRNVVIDVGTGDRDLIVGAHADAVVLDDGSLGHAMVDNAAAVAVLVRVAAALQAYALQHRVRVVLFDLEELGLLGARYFVESLDPARVAGMVNLDIAGYGDTVLFGPSASPGNQRVHASVRQACADVGHECLEFAQFPPGDDRSFQAAGIPNVSLATLPRREAHQLWLVLNSGDDDAGLRDDFVASILRTIHTSADTAQVLDAHGMTLAYNMVLQVVLQLDRRE